MAAPFLTAEWRSLAILNYIVDPALLIPHVPRGTQLDSYDCRTYMSLVGFRFERTRVRGLWIPFHSDFDEVNLRFYVRRTVGGEVRRGVVFIREVVPRWAIAVVARAVYGEHYVALAMRHRIAGPVSEGGRTTVEYGWRVDGRWAEIRMECEGKPARPHASSLEEFITEHYWGYAAQPNGGTVEYRVEHEPWRVYRAAQSSFGGDCSSLYGAPFSACLKPRPDSALLAEGSAVLVYQGNSVVSSD
jgi:uncharacterized protein YqjF (DUF2071 family)